MSNTQSHLTCYVKTHKVLLCQDTQSHLTCYVKTHKPLRRVLGSYQLGKFFASHSRRGRGNNVIPISSQIDNNNNQQLTANQTAAPLIPRAKNVLEIKPPKTKGENSLANQTAASLIPRAKNVLEIKPPKTKGENSLISSSRACQAFTDISTLPKDSSSKQLMDDDEDDDEDDDNSLTSLQSERIPSSGACQVDTDIPVSTSPTDNSSSKQRKLTVPSSSASSSPTDNSSSKQQLMDRKREL